MQSSDWKQFIEEYYDIYALNRKLILGNSWIYKNNKSINSFLEGWKYSIRRVQTNRKIAICSYMMKKVKHIVRADFTMNFDHALLYREL